MMETLNPHAPGRAWRALLASGALLTLLGSCRGATEIRLHVRTNAPCTEPAKWHGVAVYVGLPGSDVENKAPALTTAECGANGQVGSLVLVPSGAKDAEIGLRVVAGLTLQPDECAANHYVGCIVARRAVRFNAHDTLDLDIDLTTDCVGLGCDAAHTCVNGVCTDALLAATPDTPDTDADTGPTVRCGDNGVFCPTTGNVCCLAIDIDAGTTQGECKPAIQCPPTSAVLNCDDDSDCLAKTDDAGHTGRCMLSYTQTAQSNGEQPEFVQLSQCLPVLTATSDQGEGLELCETRLPCSGNRACMASSGIPANPLPGYFWCTVHRY